MNEFITFVVFTSHGYWGKAATLPEALKNAHFSADARAWGSVINCKPEEVAVGELSIEYPKDAVSVKLDKFELADLFSENRTIEVINDLLERINGQVVYDGGQPKSPLSFKVQRHVRKVEEAVSDLEDALFELEDAELEKAEG